MNPNELRNLLRGQPFVPFRIHVTDGRTFDVVHPDMLRVTARLLVVGILDPAHPADLPIRTEMIAPLHVVSQEPLTQTV